MALRWAWFVLVVLALAYAAYATRYDVSGGGDYVVDRWTHQWCAIPPIPGTTMQCARMGNGKLNKEKGDPWAEPK